MVLPDRDRSLHPRRPRLSSPWDRLVHGGCHRPRRPPRDGLRRRRDDRHDRHGGPARVAPRAGVGAEVQGGGDGSGGSAAVARARSAPPLASPRLAQPSDGTALRGHSPTAGATPNGGCRGHASTSRRSRWLGDRRWRAGPGRVGHGASRAPRGGATRARVGDARRRPRTHVFPHGRYARPRRPVDRTGRRLDRHLAAPLPPAATTDTGRRGLSRSHAVPARHDGASGPSRSVLMGMRRTHATGRTMVHSLQRPRGSERPPARPARGGGYLRSRRLDTMANALSAGGLPAIS